MALNLDDCKASIKTHSIILNGQEYVAKPLTLSELVEIQDIYSNFDENQENSFEPLKILLKKVGYPVEEILELPVQVVMELQNEIFLSLTQELKTEPKKKR